VNETSSTGTSPDVDSEPFFDGLSQGELRLQRCRSCHSHQFPPRRFCVHCGGTDFSWPRSPGHGVVYSFTVCHRSASEETALRSPFVVGLVDLAEQVRMLAPILDIDPEHARIGMNVKAAIENGLQERPMLVFKPASGEER
jgi:uncharacterized OB-fold protein